MEVVVDAYNEGERAMGVKAMAPEDECEHDMFVEIRFNGRKLAVPLSQLKGIAVNDETQEAIADWHYWVDKGYEF